MATNPLFSPLPTPVEPGSDKIVLPTPAEPASDKIVLPAPPPTSGLRALVEAFPQSARFGRRSADERADMQRLSLQERLAQIPSFDEFTSEVKNFGNFPFSEKEKAYQVYLDKVNEALFGDSPDIDPIDKQLALSQFKQTHPGPTRPERSTVEAVEDIGLGAAAGALGIGASLSSLVDLATEKTGDGEVTDWFQDSIKALHKHQSVVEKNARKERRRRLVEITNDKDASTLEKIWREMGVAIDTMSVGGFAELAGNIVPTLVLSGGIGIGAKALGLASAGRTTLASGVALSGALSAGDASQTARQIVMNTPISKLQKVEGWGELVAQNNGNKEAARQAAAEDAARTAALMGLAVGIVGSAAPGSMENILAKAVAKSPAVKALHVASGAALGGLEEAGTAVSANVAAGQQGADVTPFQSVGVDLAMGLIGEGAASVGLVSFGSITGDPAESTEDTLGRAGEENPEDVVKAGRPKVKIDNPDGSVSNLYQGKDGIWRYVDNIQPRTAAANRYLQTINGFPATEIQPESQRSKAAYDDIMNMPESEFLAYPGISDMVEGVAKEKGIPKDEAIEQLRKIMATRRAKVALDLESQQELLDRFPARPEGGVKVGRLVRIFQIMSRDAAEASSLMGPFMDAANGDISKAKSQFIGQLRSLAGPDGRLNSQLLVDVIDGKPILRAGQVVSEPQATPGALVPVGQPTAQAGGATPAGPTQPGGQPLLTTGGVRDRLRALGYANVEIDNLTPAQANDILADRRPAALLSNANRILDSRIPLSDGTEIEFGSPVDKAIFLLDPDVNLPEGESNVLRRWLQVTQQLSDAEITRRSEELGRRVDALQADGVVITVPEVTPPPPPAPPPAPPAQGPPPVQGELPLQAPQPAQGELTIPPPAPEPTPPVPPEQGELPLEPPTPEQGELPLGPPTPEQSELPPTPDKLSAEIAARFGIRQQDLSLSPQELKDRDEALDVPTSSLTPIKATELPFGSINIVRFGPERSDQYVYILKSVPVDDVVPSEAEEDIRSHESFNRYLRYLREGIEAPPISIAQNRLGNLISLNRRRLLTAKEAGIKTVRAWVSPINATTGDPLKYGEIVNPVVGEEATRFPFNAPVERLTAINSKAEDFTIDAEVPSVHSISGVEYELANDFNNLVLEITKRNPRIDDVDGAFRAIEDELGLSKKQARSYAKYVRDTLRNGTASSRTDFIAIPADILGDTVVSETVEPAPQETEQPPEQGELPLGPPTSEPARPAVSQQPEQGELPLRQPPEQGEIPLGPPTQEPPRLPVNQQPEQGELPLRQPPEQGEIPLGPQPTPEAPPSEVVNALLAEDQATFNGVDFNFADDLDAALFWSLPVNGKSQEDIDTLRQFVRSQTGWTNQEVNDAQTRLVTRISRITPAGAGGVTLPKTRGRSFRVRTPEPRPQEEIAEPGALDPEGLRNVSLPDELQAAQPKLNGEPVAFESDFDKAAYIIAKGFRNAPAYMKWATQVSGFTKPGIRRHGRNVATRAKAANKGEPVPFVVPKDIELESTSKEQAPSPEIIDAAVAANFTEDIMEDIARLKDPASAPDVQHGAFRRVEKAVESLPNGVREAIRRNDNVENVPDEVKEVMQDLGLGSRVLADRTKAWAKLVTNPTGKNAARRILEAMSENPGDVGRVNAEWAQRLLDIFEETGIPFPSVKYSNKVVRTGNGGIAIGSYSGGAHQVQFMQMTDAGTVVHEMLHAVTANGWHSTWNKAALGDQDAADLMALGEVVRRELASADTVTSRLYGGTLAVESIAEMINPLLLGVAQRLPMPDLSSIGTIPMTSVKWSDHQLPPMAGVEGDPARAWAKIQGRKQNPTLLDAIAGVVKSIINFVAPKANLSMPTVRDALNLFTLENVATTAAEAAGGRVTASGVGPQITEERIIDPLEFAHAVGEAQADSLVGSTEEYNEKAFDGEDVIPEDEKDDSFNSPRQPLKELLAGARNNAKAAPASLGRGLWQGGKSYAKTFGKDGHRLRSSLARAIDLTNEIFHDAQAPFLDEIHDWEKRGLAAGREVQQTEDTMRLAPGRKTWFLEDAMRNHGGEALQKELSRIAKKSKETPETVLQWLGYWMTANFAPVQNRRLIEREEATIADLERKRDNERSGSKRDALESAIEDAKINLEKRKRAVNNPDPEVSDYPVKLAGNMSNAAAKQLQTNIELHYNLDDIKKAASHVYTLNAYTLAIGIETGRVTPKVAADFLDRPEILEELEHLASLGADAQSLQAAARPQGLVKQRNKVAELVLSEYVPMTGDPRHAIDETLIVGGTGTSAPNVAKDRQQQGRGSVPDNGISSTFDALYRSAAFAGWRPFQKGINDLYASMTPEARSEAGFIRKKVEKPKKSGDPSGEARGGIIYRPNFNGTAYKFLFENPKLIPAIRRANMDDSSQFLDVVSTPTRWFAYAATQLSPWFAPTNWFRDLWERSETLRRYDNVVDGNGKPVNMNAVARRTWRYGMAPSLFRSTGRYAANKSSDGSRYDEAVRALAESGSLFTTNDLFSSNRAQAVASIVKHGKLSSRVKSKIGDVVDIYNRTFDLVPAVSAYLALTDAGVPSNRAAAIALDTMNFRKAGTASPFFQALYAFSRPAITGGANMLSLVYDRRRNKFKPRGVGRLAAYSLIFAFIHAFARSIADDDEGGDTLAQLSDWVKYNKIPFPLGNDIATLPMTFGLPRFGNAVAINALGILSGEKTLDNSVSDLLNFGLVPAISPLQPSSVNWKNDPITGFMLLISPTLANPLVEHVSNTNYFGGKIVNLTWRDKDQFMSEQFGYNVNEFYREGARTLRQFGGPDLAPEQFRHLLRGYVVGAPRMFLNVVEAKGKDEDFSLMGEVFHSFYRADNGKAWKSQFYGMIDQTEVLKRKINAGVITELTDQQAQLLNLRQRWEEYSNELSNRKRKVTNNKLLTDAIKNRKYDTLQKIKDAIQAEFVVEVRKILGKD